MKIVITKGVGEGPTPVAAFDAALAAAGADNYNLIPLSSIIPPGSTIVRGRHEAPEGDYGHRLYVVIARGEASQPGHEAWAGVGWTQEPASQRGLFVELHGARHDEVVRAIEDSLASMMERRGHRYGPIEYEIAGAICEQRPVCALVIAVYESQAWTSV